MTTTLESETRSGERVLTIVKMGQERMASGDIPTTDGRVDPVDRIRAENLTPSSTHDGRNAS